MKEYQVVGSIMKTNLITAKPEDKITDVQAIFDRNDFHHIPVVDDQNKLLGIISKEDVRKLYYYTSKNTTGKTWTEKEYASLTAKDVMTASPIQLDPEDRVGLAADIFLANKFHALPIVADDILLGIVTIHDLLDYAFASPEIKSMLDE